MKNAVWISVLLCALFIGCKKGDKDCGRSVNAVQPNTNPAGYEVLLKTKGFSSAAKVFFGSVEASSRAGGESDDIIAKVPAGLSGNVEVSVEEGDCIARSGGFVVSGSLPSGVQSSLQSIIIPVPSSPAPLGDIQNGWRNAADTDQGIQFFNNNLVLGVNQTIGAYEFDFGPNPNPPNNPITGTINTSTNKINLVVDRSPNNGSMEHLDGQFIELPIPLPNGVTTNKTFAILLVSRETGRQLLLVAP